ncbi:MAG: 50S ribosomal protein L30, partial [Oscillospiraceae bacterium]|nr:50S ribosomal protein L30 [Oscillospiraceae bacterium]
KKAAKPATVTVTLKKSLNGRLQNQKDCAAALGLKKVGDVKVHPENAATMGKIAKISHLVEITK